MSKEKLLSALDESESSVSGRRVTRAGERGGGLHCPFSKFKEKCPDFGKKCPN